MKATIQLHHAGAWHDAAEVVFREPELGHRGATEIDYDIGYCFDVAETGACDCRAVSVALPVQPNVRFSRTWPAFLLDLLPQGQARGHVARNLNLDPDQIASDLPILMAGAASPVGNLRIKEAALAARRRYERVMPLGLPMEEILARTSRFEEVVNLHATVPGGSSGLQGDWPKIAMTRGSDGLWYPDTQVDGGTEPVIVKMIRRPEDLPIIEAEHRFYDLARQFGIDVHGRHLYQDGVLVIPRFDRESGFLFGQESIVAAIGVAAFQHVESHETYLDMIERVSSRPDLDVAEYVLRDALNLAVGNSDNHGRNTALRKAVGTVRLAPLFDFAPMRLAPTNIGRPTKWASMRDIGRDHAPDWRTVIDTLPQNRREAVRTHLLSKHDLFVRVRELALDLGVKPDLIRRAFIDAEAIADGIGRLA